MLLLFAVLTVPAARAHEARPAYLEIKETAPRQIHRALAHASLGGHAFAACAENT